MKVLFKVGLTVFILLTTGAFGIEKTIPQEESKEVALESWDVYKDLQSPQTIEEVADMLDMAYHEGIRFQDKPIPWDTEEEEVEHPLDLLIFQWTKEFCILHNWALPECGPIVDRKLHQLIINRT